MMKKKPETPVYIEYWPLSKFLPAERNPKLHDLEEIILSIKRFGFISPALVNEKTGRLVVGHGRAEALQEYKRRFDAQAEGFESAPKRIVVTEEGEWQMPVIRGVSFDTDEDAEAYLLADNQLTVLGGWSQQTLYESLSALKEKGYAGLGFSLDTLRSLEATWGHTELVQFEAFVKPTPIIVKWRVVIPDLNEKKAREIASDYKNAIVETYRE